MEKGQVLFDDGKERDDGRLQGVLVQQVTVLGHVARGVEDVLQLAQELLVLGWETFPGAPKPGHWGQVQSAVNGKKEHQSSIEAEECDLYKEYVRLHCGV